VIGGGPRPAGSGPPWIDAGDEGTIIPPPRRRRRPGSPQVAPILLESSTPSRGTTSAGEDGTGPDGAEPPTPPEHSPVEYHARAAGWSGAVADTTGASTPDQAASGEPFAVGEPA